MVSLQRLTGMRSGEVCIMRSREFDTSESPWVYTPESHKTEHHGRTRRVYLGPRAQEILRPWMSADGTTYPFSPKQAMEERRAEMRRTRKSKVQPSLFAALDMLEGRLIGQCMPRHRHQEFIKFLKQIDAATPPDLDLHLIVDIYATHKHPKVNAWLKRHSRFHRHLIPTSSSWLNLVERFFREITDKRIRRGVFQSVEQLIEAIRAFIDERNDDPKPFVWTAKAEDILERVRRARAVLDKIASE
jgi:transposase